MKTLFKILFYLLVFNSQSYGESEFSQNIKTFLSVVKDEGHNNLRKEILDNKYKYIHSSLNNLMDVILKNKPIPKLPEFNLTTVKIVQEIVLIPGFNQDQIGYLCYFEGKTQKNKSIAFFYYSKIK